MEKTFIVFAKENFEASQKIERALTTKANVTLLPIDASKPLVSFENEVLKENDGKVILIISDNFLKTEACMNAALPFIQTLEQSKRLLIVSADGVTTDAYGITKYTTTSFDRVSQVIQYMNFWQEKFLEVRAVSRNTDNQLNDKSKVVRNISTEVGEILRLIRPLDNFQLKELEQNGYSALVNKLNFSKGESNGEALPSVSDEKISQPSFHSSLNTDNADLVSNGHSRSNGNGLQNGFKKEVKNIEELLVVNDAPKEEHLAQNASLSSSDILNHSLPLTLESLIENNDSHSLPTITDKEERLLNLKSSAELHVTNSRDHLETIENLPHFIDSTDYLKKEEKVKHTNHATHDYQIHTPEKVIEMENHFEHSNVIENETKVIEHTHVEEPKEVSNEAIPIVSEPSVIHHEVIHTSEVSPLTANSSIEERFKYANALVDSKQYDDALEQLDIIVGEDRTYVNAYMLSAYIAEQKGDYSLSQSALEKVTLLQPHYPGIYFKLGKLTEEHLPKQLKKAGRFYKEAINVEPENYLAHWNYYRFNQKNKELLAISHEPSELNAQSSQLIAELKHIVSLKPDFGDAHFELAQQYLKLGDIVNANASYNLAAEASPSLKSEHNDLTFKLPEPIKPKNDNGIIVLITGGTSGIGKATADIFAKAGYRVIITGRREERLENLTKELFEAHDNYNLALNFDVRDNAQVEKALGQLTEDWRNIDILINNAGLARGLAPIQEGLLSDWDAMIDTNIKGLLYITRVVAPIMVAKNSGHIINICSIAGKEVYPNGNVYCATKAAVDTLTRSMRVDLFKHNIRVSQIAPGLVEDTEFSLVRFHGDAERANIYTDIIPLNAGDIADTIYYMATRPAHVTIQDVLIMPTQQAGANFYNRNGR